MADERERRMTRAFRVRAVLSTAVAATALAAAPAPAAELPASGTLDLATGADASIAGATGGDLAGVVAQPAGDVNGDGRRDLLIASPGADPRGREGAGSVHVVFGPATGLPADLGSLGARGLRIDGANARDHVGIAAAPAGDVDGDGLADVLVGAPRADLRAPDAGAAYLVLGRREAGQVDLAAPGPRVVALTTGAGGDQAGGAVASVPDADGDGRPELAVGAPGADDARGADGGAAFVVFSRAVPSGGGEIDLAALGDRGRRLDGAPGGRAGYAVAGAPDANGDGRGELLVGAPLAGSGARPSGAGYVVFGSAEPGRADLAALGAGGYVVTGGPGDELLGAAVGVVGDPDSNGVTDLAFAATGADRRDRTDSGSLHVIPAKAGPEPVAAAGDDRPGFRVDGGAPGDQLGASMGPVGDLNGDKRPELVVAAPDADALSRPDSGAAYVLFGAETLDDVDLSGLADRGIRYAGPEAASHLRAVASAGDLDGDGIDDLVFGAYDGGERDTGTAYVVAGPKPAPPPPAPDPGVAEEIAAGCRAIGNVEVILDDSLSMRRADPLELRRKAVELLVTKPRNEGKVVGAFEFGSRGAQLFPPQVVQPRGVRGANQPLLIGALTQGVRGNNGGTDYNAAFKGAADDNPGAQARIFITDGGHRAGEYLGGHRGGAPTYVIGLGISARKPAGRRLERIAKETKGRAFLDVAADDLARALNAIDSALNCDVDIDSEEDVLDADDPVDQQVIELLPDARTCDIDVSWGDDEDSIEPEEIAFLDEEDGSVVARVSRKGLRRVVARPGKVFRMNGITLKGRRRGSFYGLRIAGSSPAQRLRVRYRAAKVAGGRASVDSQVTQSRRRGVEQPRRRG